MKKSRLLLLSALLSVILVSCARERQPAPLVIWVTGGLRGDWLPQGEYRQPPAGGLSRIARALELYRQPDDLLVDLGQFRYPSGVSGETRRWRSKANGFLKALTRMRYNAFNISLLDLPPWPLELAARAREYDLPLISANIGLDSLLFPFEIVIPHPGAQVRFVALAGGSGEFDNWLKRLPDSVASATMEKSSTYSPQAESGAFAILITDAPEEDLEVFLERSSHLDLVLWLSPGSPKARQIGDILVLGLGNQGNCLGRIEIGRVGKRLSLSESDLSGWLDGKSYRHHPARESLLRKLTFWRKKPRLRAYLWQVPEEMAPQKETEAQRRQSNEEADRYADLEEIHRSTPTDYAGSQRCLDCHTAHHPRDLARLHPLEPLQPVRDYPVYERCLACHAAGFDDPAGFLLPWERPDLLAVGCEACHGGSYQHALQGQPPFPTTPADSLCQDCHNAQALPIEHPD